MIPDSYFERFDTQKYRNANPVQRHLIRRFTGTLHSFLVAASPIKTVLEVGVGEGFISGYLSEHFPDIDFCGVELNPDDVVRLKEKFPRVEAHVGNIYELDFLDRQFDLVICAEVLEHVDQPQRAITQLRQRTGGHAIFSVPHEPWFMLSNLARGKNIQRLGNDIEHINHFGKRSFRELLESEFEVLELTTAYPWLVSYSKPRG